MVGKSSFASDIMYVFSRITFKYCLNTTEEHNLDFAFKISICAIFNLNTWGIDCPVFIVSIGPPDSRTKIAHPKIICAVSLTMQCWFMCLVFILTNALVSILFPNQLF